MDPVWEDIEETALRPYGGAVGTSEEGDDDSVGVYSLERSIALLQGGLGDAWGQVLYKYYNWRQV